MLYYCCNLLQTWKTSPQENSYCSGRHSSENVSFTYHFPPLFLPPQSFTWHYSPFLLPLSLSFPPSPNLHLTVLSLFSLSFPLPLILHLTMISYNTQWATGLLSLPSSILSSLSLSLSLLTFLYFISLPLFFSRLLPPSSHTHTVKIRDTLTLS